MVTPAGAVYYRVSAPVLILDRFAHLLVHHLRLLCPLRLLLRLLSRLLPRLLRHLLRLLVFTE